MAAECGFCRCPASTRPIHAVPACRLIRQAMEECLDFGAGISTPRSDWAEPTARRDFHFIDSGGPRSGMRPSRRCPCLRKDSAWPCSAWYGQALRVSLGRTRGDQAAGSASTGRHCNWSRAPAATGGPDPRCDCARAPVAVGAATAGDAESWRRRRAVGDLVLLRHRELSDFDAMPSRADTAATFSVLPFEGVLEAAHVEPGDKSRPGSCC